MEVVDALHSRHGRDHAGELGWIDVGGDGLEEDVDALPTESDCFHRDADRDEE